MASNPSRRILSRLPRNVRGLMVGSFWLTLAAGWAQGTMLLANIAVANLIGVAAYGHYALLQSLIAGLAIIAQTSLGLIVAQRLGALRGGDLALSGETASFCLAVTTVLGVAIGLTLLVGRGALAEAAFADAGLASGVALAALAIPWLAINYVQNGIFSGLEEFRRQAWLALWLSPSVLTFPAAGAWWAGAEGAVAGLAAVYFLRAALSQFVLGRLFKGTGLSCSLAGIRSNLRMLWRAALPATLAGIFGWVGLWGGQALLVRIEGGPAALGLFAAAFTIKTVLLFLPSQISAAVLPILSRLGVHDEQGESRHVFLTATAGALAITVLLAAVVIALSDDIVRLFGSDFAGGGSTLTILMLAVPLEALTINLYQGLFSRGFYWRTILLETFPRSATMLVAALILIPRYQADGLASAWLLSWVVALAGTAVALLLSRGRAIGPVAGSRRPAIAPNTEDRPI